MNLFYKLFIVLLYFAEKIAFIIETMTRLSNLEKPRKEMKMSRPYLGKNLKVLFFSHIMDLACLNLGKVCHKFMGFLFQTF